MLTLDDVRNLDPDEVTDTDLAVLKEHKDELTEDEKARYSQFLEEENPPADPPADPPKDENPPADPPKDPPKEEKAALTAKEIAELVKNAVSSVIPKKDEPKKEDDEKPFIPEDWTPKDWNEVLEKAVEYNALKTSKMTAKAKEELDSINASLDREIDELRDSGEPIPAKDSKEYSSFDKELTNLSLKYKLSSFKDAYDIYKQIKKDVPPAEPPKKDPPNKENKEVINKMGGAKIENGGKQPERSYKAIQGKTPTQVVSEFLDELE